MNRYHVHLTPTHVVTGLQLHLEDADPVITVTVDAKSSEEAQQIARWLVNARCDVQEIELAEEAA